MPGPLVYRYRLRPREFIKAGLIQYYVDPGRGCLRAIAGPVLLAAGLLLRATADGGFVEGLGAFCIGYGLFAAVRPVVAVWLAARAGRHAAATTVSIDDSGVTVRGTRGSANLSWQTVRRAGQRGGCYFIQTCSGIRIDIPERAVHDPQSLIRRFRAQGKWREPGGAQR